MESKTYEALEITTLQYNNGNIPDSNISIYFRAIDLQGNEIDLGIDIDVIEFLRWFDKNTMSELKSKAIHEIENL